MGSNDLTIALLFFHPDFNKPNQKKSGGLDLIPKRIYLKIIAL